ncbi:MAG: thioredoxin family protein [Gemmataceae bacterium]
MDRSFLSRAEVIDASRAFVCVRLTTYENAGEMSFLRGMYVGGSGEVENTTFTVLSPDGKRELVRPSRGPDHAFRDAADMAARLRRIAAGYGKTKEPAALPLVSDVRLGLNVASADGLPLVALVGDVKDDAVAKLAWSDAWRGRFVYVKAAKLDGVSGVKVTSGLVILGPDRYGRSGTALAQGDAADAERLYAEALRAWTPGAKSFSGHVRDGRREGVFWETKTPVTDPMEARARRR